MSEHARQFAVVTLIPVFRDWEAAALVCHGLDEAFAPDTAVTVRVLLVDDGTPEDLQDWPANRLQNLIAIDTLRLRRNVGHQRAIAIGLCYIHEHLDCDAVLIMDGDGEDRPIDAAALVTLARRDGTPKILFAARGRRLESRVFRVGYRLYRGLHRMLTGIEVRVGNFSVVPRPCVRRLVSMSELWNHFAATVFRSKLPFELHAIDKGRRLRGQSRMDLVSLVVHGVSALATFNDIVATRLLLAIAAVSTGVALAAAAVVGIRLFTNLAIPGWATVSVGLLALLMMQLGGTAFALMLSLLAGRSALTSPPERDYAWMIDRCERLASRPD